MMPTTFEYHLPYTGGDIAELSATALGRSSIIETSEDLHPCGIHPDLFTPDFRASIPQDEMFASLRLNNGEGWVQWSIASSVKVHGQDMVVSVVEMLVSMES